MGKHNKPRKNVGINPALHARRNQAIQRAQSLIAQSQFDEADEILRTDVPKGSKDPDALRLRGLIAESTNRPVEAMNFARKSAKIQAHPDTHLLMAQIHARHGDTLATVKSCRSALAMAPEHVHARLMLAATLEERNQVDDAALELAPVLDNPTESSIVVRRAARIQAAIMVRRGDYDEAVRIIDENVLSNDPPPSERRGALFLRAKALDRAARYDEAFATAQEANQLDMVPFDPDEYDNSLNVFMHAWTRELVNHLPIGDPSSELPVFIAGMPRSGTSLLDRIIDAHPKGAGVGELALIEQFWMTLNTAYDHSGDPLEAYDKVPARAWKDIAHTYTNQCRKLSPPGTLRVANKSIRNDLMLGALSRLFPKGRFIHIVRDPRDVAISCFMGGFNNRMYPWTARLDWIARAWSASARIMDHFASILDTEILKVNYEELVQDPETQLPRVIASVGLDWDPLCMEFHTLNRPIRTLSYDQVNQPINTKSVGRYANYQRFIDAIDWPA